MLYLKEVNFDDIDEEYKAFRSIPLDENGFKNKYYNITKEELKDSVIPELQKHSNGIDLKEGHVPCTYYFLWNDNVIVGLFKIRHYLNESLINGAGHIGYGVIKEYRGRGYATAGLKLAIDICKNLIKEDEIYLSSNKDNPASFRVQQKCGAYITHESDTQVFTRIKLN